MVHIKVRISSELVMWGLNGLCGSPVGLLSLRQTEINNKRHHHEEGCLERCRRTELFARRTMMISQPSMILTSMGQS